MEGAEYPKALYRDGGGALIWGRAVATRIVASPEDEQDALAQGWRIHPLAPDEPQAAETPKRGPGRPRKLEA